MLLPGLHSPWRVATLSIGRSSSQAGHLNEVFAQLAIRSTPIGLTFVRHASHNQQSSHSQKKDGPGKRLGAKKSGEQYVIPGNIIFRQRGTKWFPGENCGMGRDHTIFSKVHGYVKYYKDPLQHPKRQYIGVAFERDHALPYDRREPRHRRLGMFTEKIDSEVAGKLQVDEPGDAIDVVKATKSKERRGEEGRNLTLKSGYMYREANWEIGRAAERAQVIVPPFKPGDRWTAWRKSMTRKAKNAEKRVGRPRSKKKK